MRLNTSVGNINLLTDNLRSALQISGTRLTSEELNRINNYYNAQSPRMRILVNEGEFVGHFYSNKSYVKKLQK